MLSVREKADLSCCFSSSLSSLQKPCVFLDFFRWLFNSLLSLWNEVICKISLSTDELELFEELLEGAFWGGAVYFYDQNTGIKQLEKVIDDCTCLYKKLSDKWFPDIEGILFMRMSLLKIKMRALAALGQKEKANECVELVKTLGYSLPEEVEAQTEMLLMASQPKYQKFLWAINKITQGCMKLIFLLRRKNH